MKSLRKLRSRSAFARPPREVAALRALGPGGSSGTMDIRPHQSLVRLLGAYSTLESVVLALERGSQGTLGSGVTAAAASGWQGMGAVQ